MYVFEISEVKGKATDIQYDENIYYARISITENRETKTLESNISYYRDEAFHVLIDTNIPVFINNYQVLNGGYIVIEKKSILSGKPLAGAVFSLHYRNIANSKWWIKHGETLVTAGESGSIEIELPPEYWNNEYMLMETKAPSGYSKAKVGTILFTMTNNGKIASWHHNGTPGYVDLAENETTLIVKNDVIQKQ